MYGRKLLKETNRTRKRLKLELLEPRTLYSADPMAAGISTVGLSSDDGFTETDFFVDSPLPEQTSSSEPLNDTAPAASQQSRFEIIFIDEATPDYDALLQDLLANTSAERTFEIVTITQNEDGIQVITDSLAIYTDISAVHLISHGSDGNVNMGDTVLNHSTLSTYENAISSWSDAFTEDGDLLIYGCNFSATDSGKALGANIAALADVDVASSDDATGGVSLNANWVLEEIVGTIETALPFSAQLQDDYQHSLANTITVTTPADTLDGDTSSFDALILDPGADSNISLREAIVAANTQPGADTIDLPSGTYQLTIPGNFTSDHLSGDHDITSDVTITGAGAATTIISAQGSGDRVIEVGSTGSLSLSDLTIADGSTKLGSGIYNDGSLNTSDVIIRDNNLTGNSGGGVTNNGTAFFTNTVFDNNHANRGGAIHNFGTVTIEDSSFTNNIGSNTGGAGIYNDNGDAIISRSTFIGNSGSTGAAIRVDGGTISINDSTFSDNQASTTAGAIYNAVGDITISQSSFINNSSGGNSGAIRGDSGTTTITNSTFSGNESGGIGGAVHTTGGDAIIRYSTFSENNSAGNGGGIYEQSGSITIGSSIFANNTSAASWGTMDVGNVSVSEGKNIILSTTAGTFSPAPTDQFGVDPLLLSFDSTTNTYPLNPANPASPAIDNGGSTPITVDQLGALRDANPDVGAVELSTSTPPGPNEAPSIDFIEDSVFINEIHYDNSGADINESIEIAGPSGTDLTGWALELYSGTTPYDTINLTGIIPDEGNGIGAVTFLPTILQNGPNDGIALIDNTGTVVEFLSYEGVLTPTSGSAAGMISTDIGVTQTNSTQAGFSLQRTDFGSGFSWEPPSPNTLGTTNPTQSGLTLTTQVINEDTPWTFSTATANPIIIYDDNPTASLDLTLSVTSGTLAFASAPGAANTTLTFTGTQAAINAELENLLYTPDPDFNGTDTLTVLIEDQDPSGNLSSTKDIEIIVQPVNDAPAGKDKIIALDEDTTVTLQPGDFGFTDIIDGDNFAAVTITSVPANGSLELAGVAVTPNQLITITSITNGNLDFIPDPNDNGNSYADFGFQVHDDGGVTDGGIDQDQSTNKITFDVLSISDAPSASDFTLVTTVNTSVTITASDFSFSDPLDGDNFSSVTITSLPSQGSFLLYANTPVTVNQDISLAALNAGALTFTPAPNQSGVAFDGFNFRVNDDGNTNPGGLTQSQQDTTITFDVLSVNAAPSGTNNAITINEDSFATLKSADFGFSDPVDGHSFAAVTLTSLPGSGALSLAGAPVTVGQTISITDINNGAFVFTPAPNARGSAYDTFYFEVHDDGGTLNGGIDQDPTANSIVINVNGVNDAPEGSNGTITAIEDSPRTLQTVDFGFSDPIDGDLFAAIAVTTLPVNGTLSLAGTPVTAGQTISVADINNGSLAFTPAANDNGSTYDSFDFEVQDDGGTAYGGIDQDLTSNTITIDVLSVNDAPQGTDSLLSTNENSPITLAAADFGFSDSIEGDILAAVTVAPPANGILSLAGVAISTTQLISITDINNGDLVFTPALNSNGVAYTSIDFNVHDNGGTANGGTDVDPTINQITIDVLSVNNPPDGTDTTISTNEDSPVTLQAIDFGFTDPVDGNFFAAVTVTTQPVNGSLSLAGTPVTSGQTISIIDINNGSLVFTPAANDNGVAYDSFDFEVHDNGGTANGGFDQDPTANTITIDVLSVNDAPQGTDSILSITENAPLTLTSADFGFSDPNDNDFFAAVTIAPPANGTLTLAGAAITASQLINITDINNGDLVFIPALNSNGVAYTSIDFTVHDNGGTANGGTDADPTINQITIDVLSVNNPPDGADATISANEDSPVTLQAIDFGYSDPVDGNSFAAVTVTTLPGSGALSLAGAPVTSGQTISITDINNGSLVFTPAANDNGSAYDSFDFEVHDNGGTANGGIDQDPTANTITFDVLSVNDAPQGTDSILTTTENAPITLTSADFGFSDPNDSDFFAAVTIAPPANGTLTLAGSAITASQLISITDINNGDLVYTPALNSNGVAYTSIDFTVHDNGGTTNGGTDVDPTINQITIDVLGVNNPPDGTDTTISTNEDSPVTLQAIDFGYSDPVDGNFFAAVTVTTLPVNGTLSLAGTTVTSGQTISITDINNGSLVFTPAANDNGSAYDNFDFEVHDNGGTANGGIDQDPTANTITFDVLSVNDAPQGADSKLTTTENSPLTLAPVDFGFADPNDNDFFAAVTIAPPTNGTLTLAGAAITASQLISITDINNGDLVYTPALNSNGVAYTSIDFNVHDNGGTANGGANVDPTVNQITIDVLSVNNPPDGTDTTISTNEDSPVTLQAIDFGFTDPVDGNFFAAVTVTTLPINGSLSLAGAPVTSGQTISITDINNGSLVFTPVSNDNGSIYDNFDFEVHDNGGTLNGGIDQDQTPNTITIDVLSVNDAPGGANGTITTSEDTPVTLLAIDFGFTDPPDGDFFAAVTVTTLPTNGSLSLAGTSVSSGQTISITDINNGSLVFTPAANDNGSAYDNFDFEVHDNGGTANGGIDQDPTANTITFDVLSVNDAPQGTDSILTTTENAPLTLTSADFGFSDPNDGDFFAAVTVAPPANGSLSLAGAPITASQLISITDINNGDLVFTPALNSNGVAYTSIDFNVHDNGGTANGGTDVDPTINQIIIDVLSVNNPPDGADTTISTNEDSPVTLQAIDFGYSDPVDGNSFAAVTVTTLPGSGALSLAGAPVTSGQTISITDINNGSLVFTPAANDNGVAYDSFDFEVHDNGGTANGGFDQDPTANTITIDVLSVNDAPQGTDSILSTTENAPLTLTSADFGFSDPNDNDFFAAVTIAPPTNGTLTLAGAPITASQLISITDINNGDLVYTPALNSNGVAYTSIDFTVHDNGGNANGGADVDPTINQITIDVLSVNNPPDGTDATISTNEDSPVTLRAIDFGFTDPVDGNFFAAVTVTTLPTNGSLSLSGTSVSSGQTISITDINNGSLVFTPVANDNGSAYDSFDFKVHDNGGTANGGIDQDQTPNTITIDVLSVNDAPGGANGTITTSEDSPVTLQAIDFGFTDPVDGNFFAAVTVTTLPVNGTLSLAGTTVTSGQTISITDINNGSLVFTPAANDNGSAYDSFDFEVHDNGGTANGGIDQDPTANTITIDVLSVNDAPQGADSILTTTENSPLTLAPVDFGFSDPNDSNFFAAVTVTPPANGSLTLAGAAITASQLISITDINNGDLVFTPALNSNGVAYTSIDFNVHDNGGTANGGTDVDPTINQITIDVLSVNNPPDGTDTTISTNEDSPVTLQAIDFGYSDPVDGNFFAAVTVTTLPVNGTLSLAGTTVTSGQTISITDINNGSLVFTPAANDNGSAYDSFDFEVHDNGGTANGGIDQDPTANTITFDVLSVNDAPQGTDSILTTTENAPLTLTSADFGFSDPNDNDFFAAVTIAPPANGTLTLAGSAITASQLIGITDINNGDLVYTPALNSNGVAYTSIDFTVHDNGGTANGGADIDPTVNQITIDVLSVNNPPLGADTTINTNEDIPSILQSSDFGFSDPVDQNSFEDILVTAITGNGTLALNGTSLTAPTMVSVADIDNGLLVFTPAPDSNGAGLATISFNVQDDGGTANGGQDTSLNTNQVTIDIDPVNDEPQGSDATFTLLEDSSRILSLSDLGYTDAADNHAFSSALVSIAPLAGQLLLSGTQLFAGDLIPLTALNNGDVAYVPAAGASGLAYDTFGFQVQDTGGTTNGGINTDQTPATLTFNVLPVSDAPSGTDALISINEDTNHSFALSDFGFSDLQDTTPDQFQSLVITQLPVNGTLFNNGAAVAAGQSITSTDVASGNLVYSPSPNAYGQAFDNLLFRVSDSGNTNNGGENQDQSDKQILFDINNVSDAPTGTDSTTTINEDTPYTLMAADFGFSDANDGDFFAAITVVDLPVDGALTLTGNSVTANQIISITDISNGDLVYTPVANESGNAYADLSFLVHDTGSTTNGGQNVSQSLNTATFNVVPVNDAPTGINTSEQVTDNTVYILKTADFAFSDTENHALQGVRIESLPQSGLLALNDVPVAAGDTISASDLAAGALQYLPALNIATQDFIGFSVTDTGGTANGGADTQVTQTQLTLTTFTVNDAPTASDNNLLINEDSTYLFNVADFGFSDPAEQHGFEDVIITSVTGSGNLSLSGVPITTATTIPVTAINNGQFAFTPAANTSGNGYASFNFQVVDDGGTANGGQDTSLSSTLVIDVLEINDAPSGSDTTITTPEDTPRTLTVGDFGFSDADNNLFQGINITSTPAPGSLQLNQQTIFAGDQIPAAAIAQGNLAYVPGANATTMTSFDFTVIDDGGVANNGQNTDPTENALTIGILPVNDAPIGADSSVIISEDVSYQLTLADIGFSDPVDGHSLQEILISSLPSDGLLRHNGLPVAAGDTVTAASISAGNLVYTPASQQFAAQQFSFQVRDSGGTLNGGTDLDASPNIFDINITSANDAPTAQSATFTIDESAQHLFEIADFGFADPVEGHLLQTVVIEQMPSAGALLLNGTTVAAGQSISASDIANGSLSYQPNAGLWGLAFDSFQFRVQDNGGSANGGQDTSLLTETITFNVTEVNSAPSGTDNIIDIDEGNIHTFNTANFGFSDSADNHNFSSVILQAFDSDVMLQHSGQPVTPGTEVSVADINAGLLTYEATVLTGNHAISFLVIDDGNPLNGITKDQSENLITFNLNPINEPPVLLNTGATFSEGSDGNTISTTVLAATDPDDPAQDLQFTLQETPANGSLTLNGSALNMGDTFTMQQLTNSELQYSHDGSETSTDHFDFSLIDGDEDGVVPVTARFNIDITEVVDPLPPLTDNDLTITAGNNFDSAIGNETESFESTLLDPTVLGSGQFEIEILEQPTRGELTLNPDGTFLYAHDGSGHPTDSFTYQVTNHDGATSVATVNIAIEPAFDFATEFPSVVVPQTPIITVPEPEAVTEPEPETVVTTESTNETQTSSDSAARGSEQLTDELLFSAESISANFRPDEQFESLVNVVYNEFEIENGTLVIERELLRQLSVKQHNGAESIYLFETGENIRASVSSINIQASTNSSLSVAVNNSDFLRGLSRAQGELESSQSETRTRLKLGNDVAISVSISTTAGILAWMLRGGAIFGSLMAATPLWSSIDPLRITDSKKESKDAEQSAVEDMFE